jgi:hypothetical protein
LQRDLNRCAASFCPNWVTEASIVNRGGREVTDFVGTEPGTGRRLVADQYFEIPGHGTEVTLCVRPTKSEAGARVIDDIWRDSVNILRKNPVDESRVVCAP